MSASEVWWLVAAILAALAALLRLVAARPVVTRHEDGTTVRRATVHLPDLAGALAAAAVGALAVGLLVLP